MKHYEYIMAVVYIKTEEKWFGLKKLGLNKIDIHIMR